MNFQEHHFLVLESQLNLKANAEDSRRPLTQRPWLGAQMSAGAAQGRPHGDREEAICV